MRTLKIKRQQKPRHCPLARFFAGPQGDCGIAAYVLAEDRHNNRCPEEARGWQRASG